MGGSTFNFNAGALVQTGAAYLANMMNMPGFANAIMRTNIGLGIESTSGNHNQTMATQLFGADRVALPLNTGVNGNIFPQPPVYGPDPFMTGDGLYGDGIFNDGLYGDDLYGGGLYNDGLFTNNGLANLNNGPVINIININIGGVGPNINTPPNPYWG